jgi:hypothetical protein
MTEEQLRAATAGELQPLVGRVVLADYDPDWPRLFQREADRIRAVLGEAVLQLDHAGSRRSSRERRVPRNTRRLGPLSQESPTTKSKGGRGDGIRAHRCKPGLE